jgi:hypothetical protein
MIATLIDLQSMVIFDMKGDAIGWIHEGNKHIEFALGFDVHIRELKYNTPISKRIQNYSVSFFKIDGNSADRQWHFKTIFIYPPLPQKPITIDTEENY